VAALVFAILLVLPLVAVGVIGRNKQRIMQERAATVELRADELGIRRVLADGREEQVDWGEVNEVEVVRASKGPHALYGGVVVLGDGVEKGCLIPIDQLDTSGVRDALSRLLPGFEKRRLEAALAKRPPNRTTCWIRPGHEPPVAEPRAGSR
jgi:hypothetical protein